MTTSGWALRRIVDPAIEPVTLEDAKHQCQIDADLTEDDSTLTRYIKAAREKAELYTKRSFVEQTWKLTLSEFPSDGWMPWPVGHAIELKNGPVLGIDSVSYLSTDGTRTYLTADDYIVDDSDEPPKLYPAFNSFWPTQRCVPGSIEIIYRAGYPSAGSPVDAEGVPAIVKQAMLLLVAHWYNNRETSIVGTIVADAPHGFESTLDGLRTYP